MRKKKNESEAHNLMAHSGLATIKIEFWLNDDENLRNRTLQKVAKDLKTNFNIAVTHGEESNNPEVGTLYLATVALGSEAVKNQARKIMTYLESNTPGRIIADDWLVEPFPIN